MDDFENSRRDFLKKLGLTVVTTAVAGNVIASLADDKKKFKLNEEQQKLMDNYEKWMDDFIEVVKVRRDKPHDMDANKRLMELSENSKEWKEPLEKYMKDPNFASYYMIVSERMTKEIGV